MPIQTKDLPDVFRRALNSCPEAAASVVVPTRNRVHELRNLLQSAFAQSVKVDVHVMDDGSDDRTAEMVTKEFSQVHYHHVGTDRGPTFQRNRGIELAACNIVFPLDDDTLFVSPRTVEQTLTEFHHSKVGAVAIPFINVRHDKIVRQRSPYRGKIYITYAFVGAAHAIRRDVFLETGGFREQLFIMGEESDLCLRMMNKGYFTRLGNADPIHHLESPARDFGKMDFYGRRNDILFAWHNVPMPYLPAHLVGTTLNGLSTALRARRLGKMLAGLAHGYADCLRWRSERSPVLRNIYRLQRSLKTDGPQLLVDIEHYLAK
jgi:GT2 family glycosyltransferase